MDPLTGGLISGAVSLVSGLFGRNSAKKQQQLERDLNYEAYLENVYRAEQENALYRARADAAALVPVRSTTTDRSNVVTYDRTTEDRNSVTYDRTTEQSGVDMDAFMKAAEGYGFNPLTFLRSGALSLFSNVTRGGFTQTVDSIRRGGFSQTVSDGSSITETTGERAYEAAMVGFGNRPIFESIVSQGMTKVPSTGEVFGNALVAGTNQFLSATAQQDQNAFQRSLLDTQIAAAQQRDALRSSARSFYTPQSYQAGGTSVRTAGKGAGTPAGGGSWWLRPDEYQQLSADSGGLKIPRSTIKPETGFEDIATSIDQAWRIYKRQQSPSNWRTVKPGTGVLDRAGRLIFDSIANQFSAPKATRTIQGAMPGGKYQW